jgi:plastocyanin
LKHAALLSIALVTFWAAALGRQSQQIQVRGQIELSGSVDSSSAVVWLTPVGQAAAPASTRPSSGHASAQLIQKNKTFSPHLLVVEVGAAVEFPNKDPFFHNVFSLFEGKRFDLGLYEAGSTRSVIFNRAGVSYIFCNIHPEMSAVVVALKTPYYGVSDSKGMVTIPNVPPGMFELEAWHERVLPESLGSMKRNIQISATSSSFGVIRLMPQRNLTQLHKNKYGREYDNPTPNGPVYVRP